MPTGARGKRVWFGFLTGFYPPERLFGFLLLLFFSLKLKLHDWDGQPHLKSPLEFRTAVSSVGQVLASQTLGLDHLPLALSSHQPFKLGVIWVPQNWGASPWSLPIAWFRTLA